jgi:hypothetical protein
MPHKHPQPLRVSQVRMSYSLQAHEEPIVGKLTGVDEVELKWQTAY